MLLHEYSFSLDAPNDAASHVVKLISLVDNKSNAVTSINTCLVSWYRLQKSKELALQLINKTNKKRKNKSGFQVSVIDLRVCFFNFAAFNEDSEYDDSPEEDEDNDDEETNMLNDEEGQ